MFVGRAKKSPAHGVGREAKGEFLIGEVGTREEEGSISLSSVPLEYEEGVGEGEHGCVHEFVGGVAAGFSRELSDEQDGNAMVGGECFELMYEGEFLLRSVLSGDA